METIGLSNCSENEHINSTKSKAIATDAGKQLKKRNEKPIKLTEITSSQRQCSVTQKFHSIVKYVESISNKCFKHKRLSANRFISTVRSLATRWKKIIERLKTNKIKPFLVEILVGQQENIKNYSWDRKYASYNHSSERTACGTGESGTWGNTWVTVPIP